MLIAMGMLLHNVLPHFHHHHHNDEHDDDVTISLEEDHHHEHESHSNPDQHSEENEDLDFLTSLLDGHSHSSHVHRFTAIVLKTTALKKNFDKVIQLPDSFLSDNIHDGLVDNQHGCCKEVYYTTPDLFTRSLRGPPVLG